MAIHELGQYFTKDITLQKKVFEFIKNDPTVILEPSVGRGDLVQYVLQQDNSIVFHMNEIDTSIEMLPDIVTDQIIYGDFLLHAFKDRYTTIIGNPPYVKTRNGNLYIDFIKRCFELLRENGELVFIVPSDFFKLTSAANLLNELLINGLFTHIYHPNDDHLFKNATIDIVVFRYQKTKDLEQVCLYNDDRKFIINNNGMVTFNDELEDAIPIQKHFDIYVGMISGKEDVFKSKTYGNTMILTGESKCESYIYLKEYPCDDVSVNEYLQSHKKALQSRKIRKFNDNNWYQWGAPRNISTMENYKNDDCIYVYNLTRRSNVAFIGKVQYFGSNLLMMKPKTTLDLVKIVKHFNTDEFKSNFMFSGRFKVGQRQLANMNIKNTVFM